MTRAAAIVVGALVLVACGGQEASGTRELDVLPSAEAPESGDSLPDVELVDLATGATTSLADIEGPAVINLWATWCAPCRAEIPDFEEVHQARGDEVRFIGVNVGENTSDAQRFLDEVRATYDQFADPGGDVATALRATAMPVTVVIDGNGSVTTRHLGPLDQGGLNDAIDDALGVLTD